jgi:hypothetical protein
MQSCILSSGGDGLFLMILWKTVRILSVGLIFILILGIYQEKYDKKLILFQLCSL